jgi:hypothetical protein
VKKKRAGKYITLAIILRDDLYSDIYYDYIHSQMNKDRERER